MEESTSATDSARLDLEDDEHDSKETVLLRYFLQEWELVKSIIDRIVSRDGATEPWDVNKIRSIMDKYQEQGQLLEPFLESIITPLMFLVRSKSMLLRDGTDDVLDIIKPICIILYSLVTVCGYKSVIRFFPHHVSDLEIAVSLLEKCHHEASLSSLRQESTGEMETKCVTLLWLYILVLIPFDISSVDTSISDSNQLEQSEPPPLVLKILEISKDHLSSAGPMRRFSGLVLSRLLTRPDMPKAFARFVEWVHESLLSWTEDITDQFRLLGTLEALASMFKVGGRKVLLGIVSVTWADISHLIKSSMASQNPLLRQYVIKLSQRIGLTCLPHHSPSWRYMGKTSSVWQNTLLSATEKNNLNSSSDQVVCLNDMPTVEIPEEENMDVPEIVEEIIEQLLIGLRDTDTVVRWSAAKGIGRITACLTSSLAEEVLSSILELFSLGEGDGSWHGGCLALAELARRGLLLPVSFPKVVPLIIKALHYDVRRGPHSVGSHVRDAAAYVCWAFGRAYNYSDMNGILEQLVPHLLTVACYDREVNCRRAASAAFQENVGRVGDFPHGIDIVNTADYFSLATRANSYLSVAVSIAKYRGYLCSFVEELLSCKISHWDRGLRELAARALSALAKYDPDHFAGYVLERLVPCTLSTDLCMRHGATLASGELILTLHECNFSFPLAIQKKIASIVPAIEKARLYRGKGGEIMRLAVSRFIECISLAAISMNEKTRKSLLDTLTDNLRHPNSQIQYAAVEALRHFVQAYLFPLDEKVPDKIISIYLELLDDPNVAARRGAPMAFGVLPYEFLITKWKDIIKRLCRSCLLQSKPDDPDTEARVNAVKGLVSVCETLSTSKNQSSEEKSLYYLIKSDVMQTILEALDDYAVDNRGDVGSWVREAAINALERCTYILCKHDSGISVKSTDNEHSSKDHENVLVSSIHPLSLFDESIATNIIKGIAKLAVERMDKIRDVAARILQKVLHNPQYFVPCIPHRDSLEQIIPCDKDLNWGDPSVSYPRLVKLLQFSCYSKSVLSGYVISMGGLQESLSKVSIAALLEFIEASRSDSSQKENNIEYMLSTDLLWVLQNYRKCNRVIVPTLKTIEILFSRKIFFHMEDHTRDFCRGLLNSLAIELKGTKDFAKLNTGISVLGYIVSLMEPVNSHALSQLLHFLGHQYPKIRKAAADQVYLVIMQNSSLMTNENIDTSLEILSETCWDGSLEDAKQRRQQLLQLSAMEESNSIRSNTLVETSSGKQNRTSTDENTSYSSLVQFSGF